MFIFQLAAIIFLRIGQVGGVGSVPAGLAPGGTIMGILFGSAIDW
jgi:hypothetical protein